MSTIGPTDQKPTNGILNPRQQFAAQLRKIFKLLQIEPEHYKALGADIAEEQLRVVNCKKIPARHIPYGDFTIQGWLDGNLLPTDEALDAMLKLFSEQYTNNMDEKQSKTIDEQEDILGKKFADAQTWQNKQKNQPTELSHALLYAVERAKIPKVSMTRTKWNEKIESENTHNEKQRSNQLISQILHGSKDHAPRKEMTYAIDRWSKKNFITGEPLTAMEPSVIALHEQMLREHADRLWKEGEVNKSLGKIISSFRARCGESEIKFVERVKTYADKNTINQSLTRAALHQWISDISIPIGTNKPNEAKSTLHDTFITMMRAVDMAHYRLSSSILGTQYTPDKGWHPKEPEKAWLTPNHEAVFHRLFIERINSSQIAHKKPSDPSTLPFDPKTVHPTFLVTNAQRIKLKTQPSYSL